MEGLHFSIFFMKFRLYPESKEAYDNILFFDKNYCHEKLNSNLALSALGNVLTQLLARLSAGLVGMCLNPH